MADFDKEPDDIFKQQFKRIENISNARFDNLLEQIDSLSVNLQKVYEIQTALDAALVDTNTVIAAITNELKQTIIDSEILKKYLIDKDPSLHKLLYPLPTLKTKKVVKKKRTNKK